MDTKWYVVNSGMPAGEVEDRYVMVSKSQDEAQTVASLINNAVNEGLHDIPYCGDFWGSEWLWGAHVWEFDTEAEARHFAAYRNADYQTK